MTFLVGARLSWLQDTSRLIRPRRYSSKHEPLRILFCGSDEFSIASLRALNSERQTNSSLIESVDVLYRPGKRTGRGLKIIRKVPIQGVSEELGLQQYEVDNLKDWVLPTSINLIIAVSFGLLIPAEVIRSSKFGGLNVHPSLLPDLRGAAPIHHTLLLSRTHTGVSVQTLHPTRFDHGAILAQTPFPGIPLTPESTPQSLRDMLAPLGADLLLSTLRSRLYLPPLQPVKPLTAEEIAELTNGQDIRPAPKITTESKRLDWQTNDVSDILLQNRVLGDLWDTSTVARLREIDNLLKPSSTPPHSRASPGPSRLIFHELHRLDMSRGAVSQEADVELIDGKLIYRTTDGGAFYCNNCTLEGGVRGKGIRDIRKLLKSSVRDAAR